MVAETTERPVINPGPRFRVSRGMLTVTTALVLLFAASFLFAPTSVDHSALLGMLPFAAVLAIVGIGQTLVVMQGGIDLSVPGSVSLSVVIITHSPQATTPRLRGALLYGLGVAIAVRHPQRPADRAARAQPDRRDPGHQRSACTPPCWASRVARRGGPPTCSATPSEE